MARLFISHSSANNDKAVEVRDWLARNGWDDVFLDLDPERGIVAGQRWKDALQKAAYRCEVVLALVSKEWLASGWCKSEIDAARLMGKKVMAALVNVDKSAVPLDLIDEQFIDLTGDPQAYRRLKEGLKRSGLDPTTFPFDADRPPYPGFAYLEEKDAAVFFGRDAQIVRGLDEIRRLARTGVTRMFVILGASGSGKSSFLRAGLWPRLKRDDLAWLPLPIVRPERAAISGKYGLAESLYETVSDPRFAEGMRQRGLPRSRVDIQDFIEKTGDGLAEVLAALRDIAQTGASLEKAAPLTILLAIDQGEELFNEEGGEEARRFIDILTRTLAADARTMAILVMRSDAFPLVQNEPTLAALPKDTFTLDMMLEGSYRAVIEGPARLLDPPLLVDPQLVDALLEDISGQDALPLLAFTLRHLYDNTRVDNALTLAGYDKIGRVKGVIAQTVDQAYAEAVAKGEAPKDKEERLKLARSAFIPHLAQVNPAGQFVRRVSPRDKIPDEARPLVDRFAEQRLLIRDRRQDAEVIEVAHEALLRQPPFSDWLSEDREFLLWRDRLTQARTAFEADERGLFTGRELAVARSYMQTRAERDFEPADLAFIRNSVEADDKRRADEAEEQRRREAAEKEEQERRLRDAERIAEEQTKVAAAQKRFTWAAVAGLVVALALAGAAIWQYRSADQAKKEAVTQSKEAQSQREIAVQQKNAADQAKKDAYTQRDRAVQAEDTANKAKDDAYQQRDRALKAESAAKEATAKAEASAEEALQQRALAEQQRDAAERNKSQAVAALADFEAENGSPSAAARLALSTLPRNFASPERPYAREAEVSLLHSLLRLQEIRRFGHANGVTSVALSPDGRILATGSFDKTARLWEVATGREISTLKGHDAAVSSVAFSPDGRLLATGTQGKTAHVWEVASGNEIAALEGKDRFATVVAFSPDGRMLGTGSYDETYRLWNVSTRQNTDSWRGQEADGSSREGFEPSLAFSPDGRFMAAGSKDNTARIWALGTHSQVASLRGHGAFVSSVAFSPDGRMLITGSVDGTAKIWEVPSGREIVTLKGHEDGVYSVAFSPDGHSVATVSADKTLRLWGVPSGQEVARLRGHQDLVGAVLFSPDQHTIFSGSIDKTARQWEVATGDEIPSLPGPKKQVEALAFSPDGNILAMASIDGTAQLWDANTGQKSAVLRGHSNWVKAVAFSPDGRELATGSLDGTVRLWELPSLVEIAVLRDHEGGVESVAFSPDGRMLATGGRDRTARLWNAKTGEQIAVLRGHAATLFRCGSRNYGDRDKGLATVVVVREPIEVPHDPS